MTSVFARIRDAEIDGFSSQTAFRKVPTQVTGANVWFDLSMSPGNPVPNYYIGTPGVFTPLRQSADGGIPHGGNVSPKQKHISYFLMQTAQATIVPAHCFLLDYLGFYPFLDESVTDIQPLDNTIPVPRYTKGAQLMPVVVAGQTGGQLFQVIYTNDQGVPDRVTPPHAMGTQAVNGTVISSAGAVAGSTGPFMALQDGDTGVAMATGIQFLGTGDIGLISLAIVVPILEHTIRGIDAPVEVVPVIGKSSLPVVKDDAYLNTIIRPSGTVQSATIIGAIRTTWI